MLIYLHIGTEKTGSSYLQTLLALNRDLLKGRLIYFPTDVRYERLMLAGRTSPGNASVFSAQLRAENFGDARKWLERRVRQARRAECRILLLSNETLVEGLSTSGAWELLRSIDGVTGLRALAFVRDPVSHALSLYRHRAKSAAVPPIQTWLSQNYSLHQFLDGLIDQSESGAIAPGQLSFRKYSPVGACLEEAFFCDWLGIEAPNSKNFGRVNSSLTFSELAILRELFSSQPWLAPYVREAFEMMNPKKKASESELDEAYRRLVEQELSKDVGPWERLNTLMPLEEQLTLPSPVPGPLEIPSLFRYSEHQLHTLTRVLARAGQLGFKARHWLRRNLRSRLARAKWGLVEWTGTRS